MVLDLHKKYVDEVYDDKGILQKFTPKNYKNFNFSYDVMDVIGKAEPGRRAMLWCTEEGNERTFTFGDLMRYSSKAANLFASKGIKKGDKVMLVLKRHYQFWFAVLALHKLGAVGVPATNMLTKKDFVYRFQSADVSAIVCTAEGDVTNQVDVATEEYNGITAKFTARGTKDGWVDFDAELEAQSDVFVRVDVCETDPMLLYFTSGTTGYPKMVVHDFTYPIAHILTAKHWHNVDPEGLHLTLSETGWAKSVWGKLYGQFFMGAGIFVCDFNRFSPVDLLPMFKKYNITTFCAPPTMFRFFIKEDLSKYDLSSLQYATIAGEALNPEVYNQFKVATGLKLMEGFGQTETTLQILNSIGMEPKPGSMGKPSPAYDIDLTDEDGNSVPTGAVGEIVLKTGTGEKPVGVFTGYHKDEKTTLDAWHDGVYHTGDTAWKDEDGYYWYVGRTDDIIKSSGYRIGPFEIESVLMEHKSVLECAITGVPDEIRGQVIKATIVLAKGFTASDELKKELQDHVKRQTAPYKYPRIIDFVEELPKTISGKIRRVEIRKEK